MPFNILPQNRKLKKLDAFIRKTERILKTIDKIQ